MAKIPRMRALLLTIKDHNNSVQQGSARIITPGLQVPALEPRIPHRCLFSVGPPKKSGDSSEEAKLCACQPDRLGQPQAVPARESHRSFPLKVTIG
jgi:hypothetical protein